MPEHTNLVIPFHSNVSIGTLKWCNDLTELLAQYTHVGWQLMQVILHENNRTALIMQFDDSTIQQSQPTEQLDRIEQKLDELLAEPPLKRRRFKLDARNE